MKHRWTTFEEAYLRDKYPTTSTKLIAKALNITYGAVKARAYALCLIKNGRQERTTPRASSKTKELAKQGIYRMEHFNGRPSPPLRKQEFRGIPSTAGML